MNGLQGTGLKIDDELLPLSGLLGVKALELRSGER
jgi:hypothetical protein